MSTAQTTTTEPQESTKPAKTKAKIVRVGGVFGDMRHLFTNELIPHNGDKKVELDAWLQSQIDAGKIVVVED